MITKVQFVNKKVEEAFEKLKSGKYEEERLCEWISRAFIMLRTYGSTTCQMLGV